MSDNPSYELFEELGQGEHTVVHRGYDLDLGREVAIKHLKASTPSESPRNQQFLQEASFLAQYEHEHILRIYSVIKDRGWIVMELMKGNLADRVNDQAMPADTVRSVLRQILGALEFLHQKNKVHGAVRPSNILINDQGTAKLSDFESTEHDGQLRAPTGGKKYLAPELIRPEFGDFGPAVDLYCLGLTALELLSGPKFLSLFSGKVDEAIDPDVAWLRWHSSEETLAPVKQLCPQVPDDLARLIDRLMAKNVKDRPQSARAALELLSEQTFIPVVLPAAGSTVPTASPPPPQAVREIDNRISSSTKKSTITSSSKGVQAPKTTKDKVNDFLGKPYILWPLCASMLIGAVLIGWALQTPSDEETTGPEPGGSQLAKVQFNIEPEAADARLYLNGVAKELGADGSIQLAAGNYEFRFKSDGFEDYVSDFDLQAEDRLLEISLQPQEPAQSKLVHVQISILPKTSDARLSIDGVVVTPNKPGLYPIEIGSRVVQVNVDGFHSFTETVQILPDTSEIKVNLEALPPQLANVRLEISPDGDDTKVVANGTELTPNATGHFELSPGRYEFEVSREGFESAVKTLEVLEGAQSFSIALKALPTIPSLAQLRLNILPDAEGASISIDGQETSILAGAAIELEAGEYQLVIKKEGYLDHEQTVSLSVDKTVEVRLLERPQPRSWPDIVKVNVAVSPPPEEWNLGWAGDDRPKPEATITQQEFKVDAETFKEQSFAVVLRRDGYKELRRSYSWNELIESKFKLRFSLEPIGEIADDEEAVIPIKDPLETLFVNADQLDETRQRKTEELANEFTGQAELVIDSGGFLDELSDVSFSPDGTLIAAAGGKVVRIWNIETGELAATLRGDRSRTSYGNVYAAQFSPDGKTLLVGINDYKSRGSIREYSTSDFSEIKRLVPGHTAPCRKIAYSGTGSHRISADADGNVLVADTTTDQLVGRISAVNPEKPIFDVISFPDSRSDIVLAVDFGGPRIFAPSGRALGPQDDIPDALRGWFMDIFGKQVQYPFGSAKDPRILDFAMEQGVWGAAGVGQVDGANKFWAAVYPARNSADTNAPSAPLQVYDGHRWSITCIDIGPRGGLAATGDKFGEVHIWDRNTGKRVWRFKGQGKSIYEVAFDRNSNRVAFGTKAFTPDRWNRNNFGAAQRVLDLRQRAILPLSAADNLQLDNEQTELGAVELGVTRPKGEPSFRLNLKQRGNVVSHYRFTSGRNPTVYSLIAEPKLGVSLPAIVGDSEGLLALWDTSTDELKRAFLGHGSLVSGVSLSQNGKLMVSASTDRTIRFWSLENYVPTGTFDFKFENTSVVEVRPGSSSARAGVQVGDEIIAMDGLSLTEIRNRMLTKTFEHRPGQVVPVTMRRDGREYTYRMTMNAGFDYADPILNFYVGDDDQWIIWSPTGYYDASPGADQLIGFHVNRGPAKSARFFEVQQFRRHLYRPDVIDLILDGHSAEEAVQILNDASPSDVVDEHDFRDVDEIALFHPPHVTITAPAERKTSASRVTLTAEITSPNGLPIKQATLLHNGNAVEVFNPADLRGESLSIEHAIELVAGVNHLAIVASNSEASSMPVSINIVRTVTQPPRTDATDVHVLAIGVSTMKTPGAGIENLNSAASDAQSFVEAVVDHKNGKLYGDVHVRTLAAADATRTKIVDGLQWLVDRVKPNDTVMIFFSGYGFADAQENFYLATHDVDLQKLRSTALGWREITRMLHEDLPKCTRLVFLDARPAAGGLKPGMRNPLLDLAAPELGTTFFASNTLQQTNLGNSTDQRGVFVQAILDTLRDEKADLVPTPGDQLFNPTELAKSIRVRVQQASAGRQLPTYFAAAAKRKQNLLELFPTGQQN